MEYHVMSNAKLLCLKSLDGSSDKSRSWLSSQPSTNLSLYNGLRWNVVPWGSRKDFKNLCFSSQKCKSYLSTWRIHCSSISLEEEFSSVQRKNFSNSDEDDAEASSEDVLPQPLSCDELKSILADSERAKILRKLSEANQHNRFLKRQLQVKEDALVGFKSELVVAELEIQSLVNLAEEIANSEIPEGTRKIKGKYIQSHLLSRLEAVNEKLKEQIKDVEIAKSKEVPLFWCGMAESVQVMGSFDGWSQGEHLSPEYTGSYTKFSTTMLLRPGRYEIKFLVDGEWQLSPEFTTVGEGLMQNNLLIVD